MAGTVKTAEAKLVQWGDKIHCSGQEGGGGHPRVFLRLRDGRTTCPYCGRLFVARRESGITSDRS